MSKSKRIYDWQEWVEICEKAGVNPHENADCGFDEGMGNSDDYEYRGKYPEKEKEEEIPDDWADDSRFEGPDMNEEGDE